MRAPLQSPPDERALASMPAAPQPLGPAGFGPSPPLSGRFRAPGSKSIAQRALVCAGLAGGATRIAGLPDGDDVARALALVEACGATVERLAPAAVRIQGRPPGPHRGPAPRAPLDLGESGTLARFALATLALCGRAGTSVTLQARGSLRARASRPLIEALARSGVRFASRAWPLVFDPLGPPSEVHLEAPQSSQEVSALLIALAAWPDALALEVRGAIPSRPYVELTLGVLGSFGVSVVRRAVAAGERFEVRGPLAPPEAPLEIEPDASLAAVALAAACLTGGDLTATGIGPSTRQGDARIVDHLAAFGCATRSGPEGLFARGRPLRGATLDLAGEPDLAPPLVAVAAAAALAAPEGARASRLTGLETLPGKESSRIEVLARGLARAGWLVEADARSLTVLGAGPPPSGAVVLDPAGDHRMAFAFALLGLVRPGIAVADPGCTAKSWPGFWRELEALGVRRAGE